MGNIGYGYGSECHLLRYMGRHRNEFDKRVGMAVGGHVLEWFDFSFNSSSNWPDQEIEGLNLLPEENAARAEWKDSYWPQSGRPPNWDTIGKISVDDEENWVLVEAKAHTEELKTHGGTKAKESGDRPVIRAAFEKTISAIGAEGDPKAWLGDYYQYANRLAVLNLLTGHKIPARLLFIYFLGDCHNGWNCPKTEEGWKPALDEMYKHLGLTGESELEKNRIHKIFLPITL